MFCRMRPLLGEERESGEEIRHVNISPEKNMKLTKFADKANKCIACGSKTSTYDFEFVWIQKKKTENRVWPDCVWQDLDHGGRPRHRGGH